MKNVNQEPAPETLFLTCMVKEDKTLSLFVQDLYGGLWVLDEDEVKELVRKSTFFKGIESMSPGGIAIEGEEMTQELLDLIKGVKLQGNVCDSDFTEQFKEYKKAMEVEPVTRILSEYTGLNHCLHSENPLVNTKKLEGWLVKTMKQDGIHVQKEIYEDKIVEFFYWYEVILIIVESLNDTFAVLGKEKTLEKIYEEIK
jgi:hypothetical protein